MMVLIIAVVVSGCGYTVSVEPIDNSQPARKLNTWDVYGRALDNAIDNHPYCEDIADPYDMVQCNLSFMDKSIAVDPSGCERCLAMNKEMRCLRQDFSSWLYAYQTGDQERAWELADEIEQHTVVFQDLIN